MSAKLWALPRPNPDRHVFLKDSNEELHLPSGDCWCAPELRPDPDDATGKEWIWFHRVLN